MLCRVNLVLLGPELGTMVDKESLAEGIHQVVSFDFFEDFIAQGALFRDQQKSGGAEEALGEEEQPTRLQSSW